MKESYTEIGRLKKTYGQKGDLRYVLFNGYEELLQSLNHFFVHLDGIYVPFFPQNKFDISSKSFKIEGINSDSDADILVGKPIYVPSKEIKDVVEEDYTPEFVELIGFKLLDQENTLIGKIVKIEEFPMQEIGILSNGQMIPLNESLFLEIDRDKKELKMDLPDGILDI